jgi:hypothetical protein
VNEELIQKLQYSYVGHDGAYSLSSPLKDSLRLISDFFTSSKTNKLCLVFPSKEYTAQWLSMPITFLQIEHDYNQYKDEIFESYKSFQAGEKLLLNNDAVVQWVGLKSTDENEDSAVFRTKSTANSSSLEIAIPFKKITKLQRTDKKILSSQKKVMSVLPEKNITTLEYLLGIKTYGNKEFIKNKICLVSKYKFFNNSIDNVCVNHVTLPEYIQASKINEDGIANNGPLLLTNNLTNLALYLTHNSVSKIIIDGLNSIHERGTDFSDIDKKNTPTILITDLSEIENFEYIKNYGFEFFNFTKENLDPEQQFDNSPFHTFNKKLKKYFDFNLVREICQDIELEAVTQKIHFIEKDDSNNDLNIMKIHLIQITNTISRICHVPTDDSISSLRQKLNTIDNLFQKNKIWLGDSQKSIEESISLLNLIIEKFAIQPSDKCIRLRTLMSKCNYDYIICPTEDEALTLKNSLVHNNGTKIISVADVNDNLLTNEPVKAIITGWAKSNNINRILSSFLFSELTLLFYQFENKYYNSLQRRNRKFIDNVKSTVNIKGIAFTDDLVRSKEFKDLYSTEETYEKTSEDIFNILDFEIRLDDAQYSKYIVKENLSDSTKAKRIDFEDNSFIYSGESHKFLVINDLIEKKREKTTIHRKKQETLKLGDIIAFINTDRDILAELVERNTPKQDLEAVKQWTNLWKNLLKEYYASIGSDFKKLVEDLRSNYCKKHELTIKTWLQDENRIGPDDNADLISIALLTNSDLLNKNINIVRDAISKMTGWRMKASDFITDKIKKQIYELADNSIIGKKILIDGLGRVSVLKVIEISDVWENIDVRYVNRLLQKEII